MVMVSPASSGVLQLVAQDVHFQVNVVLVSFCWPVESASALSGDWLSAGRDLGIGGLVVRSCHPRGLEAVGATGSRVRGAG